MQKISLYAFFILLISTSTAMGQFSTSGDTESISCNCYQVTDDVASENGSFHRTTAINLTAPFDFKFTVNFGCEDTGGEGLAFLLQSAAWTTGTGGAGLGYEGIAGNVLSVEFDTRDNDAAGEVDNWDVASDHISLQDNGDTYHEAANPNNLLGIPSGLNAGEVATPHNIKPGFPEMEDCEDHLVRITWTPGANQTIQISVDGIISLTYIGDMITDQFGGNPNVLWGWTGSTGVFSNVQTVCLALEPDFNYSAVACPGEAIDFTDASFAFYDITEWNWDFAGLGSSTLENPGFTFDESGAYDVDLTITDSEGCENTVTLEVPIGFETETSVDDAMICPGSSTIIHASGNPFEDTECCFKLVLNDLWGDYWGSGVENEIEIVADGETFGFYTPTSFDPGSGTSDTVDLCFEQGTELEFIIHGEDSPAECSYYFLDEDLNEIIYVNGGFAGTWVEGATEYYTVDCGLVAPEYTYLWDNAPLLSDETDPDPTATITTDTWFHVEITDPATGCTIIDSIEVGVNPPVDAIISGYDQICDGEEGELTIEFTGSAPFDIDITGPGGPLPTITDILYSPYTLLVGEDGNYTITYVTGDGCEGTFSGTGTIDVIVPFSVDIEASATYCEGDPITDLNVVDTDGGTIKWYDNPDLIPPEIGTGPTFTPFDILGSTTYYATETEGVLGCEGPADAVTITINPVPPAPVYTGTTEYCEGDPATALIGEPSLAGTLTWYDGPLPGGAVLGTGLSFVPDLVAPGLTIYVTETAEGCESEATEIIITVSPTPEPPVVDGTTEYCEDDVPTDLLATIGSGGSIEWRSEGGILLEEGTSFTPTLTVGETTILVYEVLGGCQSEPTEVVISVQASPTVNVPDSLLICKGDSVLVNAENNGYEITWSDGQEGESVWLSPEVTTDYIVTATNPACGSSSSEITVHVYDPPLIETSKDTVIGSGGDLELWARSEGADYFYWSPEVYNCITEDCSEVYVVPESSTLYIVTVTDQNGCSNSDSIFVDLNGTMEIFVPNIFSPNGDGHNDNVKVYGPHLFNFNFEIYDRWGKRVFQSDNQNEGWDGTFNDKLLAPQTFVYVVTGETILGETIKLEGNVTIIK